MQPCPFPAASHIHVYAGADRAAVLPALEQHKEGGEVPTHLAILASGAEELSAETTSPRAIPAQGDVRFRTVVETCFGSRMGSFHSTVPHFTPKRGFCVRWLQAAAFSWATTSFGPAFAFLPDMAKPAKEQEPQSKGAEE